MGNSAFKQIEKKHPQAGVDYVIFRYYQRQCQPQGIIDKIIQRAKDDQTQTLELIGQEKKKLQEEFNQARRQVEAKNPGCIQKSEIKNKISIYQYSEFNKQLRKLDAIQNDLVNKYTTKYTEVQDKVEQNFLRKLNKSAKDAIPEYDSKSDNAKKAIQDQCVKAHPQQVRTINVHQIESQITQGTYRDIFDSMFDKDEFLQEAETGRNNVRNRIVSQQGRNQCC